MNISIENKIGTLDYEVQVTNCMSNLENKNELKFFLDKLENDLNLMSEPRGDWSANDDGLYCEKEDGETESYLVTMAQDYNRDDEFKGTLYYSDSL